MRGRDIRAVYSLPSGGVPALDQYHRAVEAAIDEVATDCAAVDTADD